MFLEIRNQLNIKSTNHNRAANHFTTKNDCTYLCWRASSDMLPAHHALGLQSTNKISNIQKRVKWTLLGRIQKHYINLTLNITLEKLLKKQISKNCCGVHALQHFPAEYDPSTSATKQWAPSNEFLFRKWGEFLCWIAGLVSSTLKWEKVIGLLADLPQALASGGSHSYGICYKSQNGFLLYMVCHRVGFGMTVLEWNQEFVEKRSRISSAWKMEWEFEYPSLGSATRAVQHPVAPLWILFLPQKSVCLITGFELRVCKNKHKPQLDLRFHADRSNKCVLLILVFCLNAKF